MLIFIFLFVCFGVQNATALQRCVFSKYSPSEASTTERSFSPLGFHELIHFSSHTLTFTPNAIFMSAGREWVR